MFLFADFILVTPLVCLLFASIILTFKTKFIQFRAVPLIFKMFRQSVQASKVKLEHSNLLAPHKALFTAMSTTIGIGNIVGPAIAIRLGGPGALLGFLLAVIFGAATTFIEVMLAIKYRVKNSDGSFVGGPMQYLQVIFGRFGAFFYAFFAAILLIVWSSNQSNTLADILFQHGISKYYTAGIVTLLVFSYLVAGIKHIGNLASKLVPIMFFVYCGACLWIIFLNIANIPQVIRLVVSSAFCPQALSGAAAGYSIHLLLRWGLAKGTQASEAGVGTASLPHVQSNNNNAFDQGVLAMASTYSVAIICTLSGLVTLLTGSWADHSIPVGMSLIAVPFGHYFSVSALVLVVSSFLFAFGTILGNAYNGSRCFLFLTKNKWVLIYNLAVGVAVFCGSIFDVEFIWSISDYFVLPVAMINIVGVLWLTFFHKIETRNS